MALVKSDKFYPETVSPRNKPMNESKRKNLKNSNTSFKFRPGEATFLTSGNMNDDSMSMDTKKKFEKSDKYFGNNMKGRKMSQQPKTTTNAETSKHGSTSINRMNRDL